MEKLLDASKADLVEGLINHPRMMSSRGNEDLLAQLHHGKSGMDLILVMRPLLDLLLLGLEIDHVAMVVVRILTMEARATMQHLQPTRLHGPSKPRLTQLPLHMRDIQLLVTPAVINLKELRLALPLLLV